jgi:hypothetical protein
MIGSMNAAPVSTEAGQARMPSGECSVPKPAMKAKKIPVTPEIQTSESAACPVTTSSGRCGVFTAAQ